MKRRDFLKLTIGASALAPLASAALGNDLGSVARIHDVLITVGLTVLVCEKPKGSTSLQFSRPGKNLVEYDAFDTRGSSWKRAGTFYVVCKPSAISAQIIVTDGFVKPGAVIFPK